MRSTSSNPLVFIQSPPLRTHAAPSIRIDGSSLAAERPKMIFLSAAICAHPTHRREPAPMRTEAPLFVATVSHQPTPWPCGGMTSAPPDRGQQIGIRGLLAVGLRAPGTCANPVIAARNPATHLEARVGIEPAYADLQSEQVNNIFNALRDLFLHKTARNRLFLLNGPTYFYTGFWRQKRGRVARRGAW